MAWHAMLLSEQEVIESDEKNEFESDFEQEDETGEKLENNRDH